MTQFYKIKLNRCKSYSQYLHSVDLLSSHSLSGELLDLLNSTGSSVLEGDAIDTLAHVNGLVTSSDLVRLRLSDSFLCFDHFNNLN